MKATATSALRKSQGAIALVMCVGVIYLQALASINEQPHADAYRYMGIADALYHGETSATASHAADSAGLLAKYPPAYPFFLSVLMRMDRRFARTVDCLSSPETRQSCHIDMGLMTPVQILLAALAAWLVWLAGLVLTRRPSIAWIALGLVLATHQYAYYATKALTENLALPLFTAATLCLACAVQRRGRLPLSVLAGLLVGLSALSRPAFAYLGYGVIVVVGAIAVRAFLRGGDRKALLVPMAFVLAFGAVIVPWVVRNGIETGTYGITNGYAADVLTQRVAFNRMTWREWGASFVYGLPDFGDTLARKLFPADAYKRLAYDNPKGFYYFGSHGLGTIVATRAGGDAHRLSYLLRNEVVGHLFKHIAVTVSLAWRGMWVAKYWGLVTIPMFVVVLVRAIRRRWWTFVAFAAPPWFMLVFHAFVSVNAVRFNLVLLPVLSVAAALCLMALASRLGQIRKRIGRPAT